MKSPFENESPPDESSLDWLDETPSYWCRGTSFLQLRKLLGFHVEIRL